MNNTNMNPKFVVCIKNEDYQASLELRKIYQVLPDPEAADKKMFRIIDESGEDYIYPYHLFAPIEIPQSLEQILSFAR